MTTKKLIPVFFFHSKILQGYEPGDQFHKKQLGEFHLNPTTVIIGDLLGHRHSFITYNNFY